MINKNDNIHKPSSKNQMIDQTNIKKYRVAAYITEYNYISKLNFLRIIIPTFMKIENKTIISFTQICVKM